MRARIGEANMGALGGAVAGSIGGLFVFGIVRAIVHHDLSQVFRTPVLGLICFVCAGVAGWFVGGQLGPLLAGARQNRNVETLGGALGGLIPVILIALWGFYLMSGR